MAKEQINIRVNDLTRSQIDEITTRFNMSITELVTAAIERFYNQVMSQQQYTVFRFKQLNGDEIASVVDELRYQKAVANLPKHSYPSKPVRADFTVWEGKAEDIPAEYLK